MPKARSQAGDHRLTSTNRGTTSWIRRPSVLVDLECVRRGRASNPLRSEPGRRSHPCRGRGGGDRLIGRSRRDGRGWRPDGSSRAGPHDPVGALWIRGLFALSRNGLRAGRARDAPPSTRPWCRRIQSATDISTMWPMPAVGGWSPSPADDSRSTSPSIRAETEAKGRSCILALGHVPRTWVSLAPRAGHEVRLVE